LNKNGKDAEEIVQILPVLHSLKASIWTSGMWSFHGSNLQKRKQGQWNKE